MRILSYRQDILSTFRPHLANYRILAFIQQALEVLEECIFVLVEKAVDIVYHIASIVLDFELRSMLQLLIDWSQLSGAVVLMTRQFLVHRVE